MDPPANEDRNARPDLEAGASRTRTRTRTCCCFRPTNTINTLPENPSTNERSTPGLLSNFMKLLKTVRESVFSSIIQCFDLTKSAAQQKALLLLCVAAAAVDPLFFYIPVINDASKCLTSDRKLGVISISLRTVVDLIHLVLWSFYYENKWKLARLKLSDSAAASSAPQQQNNPVTRKEGEIPPPGNPCSLSPRNSKVTGRFVEILCILPLPQAAALAILIIKGSPRSQQAVTWLKFLVLGQYVIRAFRVFPAFHEATTNSFSLLKSRFWIGAGFNLLLFVIASHILGAFWYLLSVGRTMDCWKSACRSRVGCNIDSLYCGGPADNKSYLDDYCTAQQATNSSAFDFGVYLSALESNIVASTKFPLKLGYCFWWGLRNLSSLGQNLNTSAYEWEICFSICISIMGLILFSLFIGNMQAYFQHKTNKDLEKMEDKMKKVMKKQGELDNWRLFKLLPQNLRQDIASCVDEKWLDTPMVDLQTVLDYFPKDVSRNIKNYILWELRRKVNLFEALNKRSSICMSKSIKPEVFAEGSLVFRKDCPVNKLVFVLHGKIKRTIDLQGIITDELREWSFCGEELLKEIIKVQSNPQRSIYYPLSTADVEACSKVEAFVIEANDLIHLVSLCKEAMDNILGCIIVERLRKIRKIFIKTSEERPSAIATSGGNTEGSTTEVRVTDAMLSVVVDKFRV